MKITSILLWVTENKLSEKFYKRLGFIVTTSNDRLSIVNLDGFELQLVNMRDDEMFNKDSLAGDKGKGMYIYINVSNADQAYAKMVKDGIKPTTEPRDWDWGNREFIVKDPDGYKLCFWQKISK
jgi:predicted enzyme related to lactoylglutathione lyase